MLSWAVKKGFIKTNPCKNVKFLKEEIKNRELLTQEDIKKLFGPDWETYWGKYLYCLINKLAACTGMRIGELLGLKGGCVTDKDILVNRQYGKYGDTDTKTHTARCIPVSNKVITQLRELITVNGDGYIFSNDGGSMPVSRKSVTDAFSKALDKLGIDRPEQKKRGLSFHSWRHFFNTSLLLADIPEAEVRAMTGHKSQKMTNRYTHVRYSDLNEIITVQERLFNA